MKRTGEPMPSRPLLRPDRSAIRSRTIVTGAMLVGVALLAVIVAIALGVYAGQTPVSPTKVAGSMPSAVTPVPPSVAAVRQVDFPPSPSGSAPKVESDRVPGRGGEVRPYRVTAPFNILDGLTFAPENAQPTRIANVSGPAAQAVCVDADGRLWACGLQARAALSRLTAGKTVECTPTGAVDGRTVMASCRVDGQDVSQALVEQGFARPTDPGSRLGRVEARAREASLGLWNGRWQIR